MTNVVASSDAYTKALLHCFKYPTQAVLGFLVGKRIGDDSATCYVTDVYPLFHSLPIGAPHPMLEVAYAHCQAAANASGVTLLGVYLANEVLDDHTLSSTLTRPLLEFIATRLNHKRPLVWFVDNESMTSPPTACSVTAFIYEPGMYETAETPVPRPCDVPLAARLSFGEWNPDTLSADKSVAMEAVLESIRNALDACAQFKLVDLEDHLEDPRLNYIDQSLTALVARQ